LLALDGWIAEQADPNTAYKYINKIAAHAATPSTYTERGASRDDLSPGVRIIPYRRRTMIAYRVLDDMVEILAIAHAGRDLGGAFN
jgi:toxin ParE1/3/4